MGERESNLCRALITDDQWFVNDDGLPYQVLRSSPLLDLRLVAVVEREGLLGLAHARMLAASLSMFDALGLVESELVAATDVVALRSLLLPVVQAALRRSKGGL